MIFDLDQRTAGIGVGEFCSFALGPREAGNGSGSAGVWRAQLGTHWHNELRARAMAEHGGAAEFEIPITGRIAHRGWTLSFSGRIDQIIRRKSAPIAAATRVTGSGAENSTAAPPCRPTHPAAILREIKTVTRPLPADESELRRDYPEYFIQLATYIALSRLGLLVRADDPQSHLLDDSAKGAAIAGELVFVETSEGLAQTVGYTSGDDVLFRAQLDRITEFLDLRLRARQRLRGLRFRPAFAQPRPGQETTLAELTATFERRPLVLFEAPTGFGKTGVLLEFALHQLRSGHFDRALYLTSKSTGQLQVVRTLTGMTAEQTGRQVAGWQVPGSEVGISPAAGSGGLSGAGLGVRLGVPGFAGAASAGSEPGTCNLQRETDSASSTASVTSPTAATTAATPVAAWHVRNKAEHCVNTTFHCVRDNCAYLAGATERWGSSGLARFYLDERHARDLDTLRAAGRDARICPYEITRTALAFNDVWIGDYNYVFAPRNRGLFYEQPGFNPARTLLLIDEAHNLPSRVADVYSHAFTADEAFSVRDELNRIRPMAALVTAWDHWCHFLQHLRRTDAVTAADEDDARHLLAEVAKQVSAAPLDYAALGPNAADALWRIPALLEDLNLVDLPRLWWGPRDRELMLTCLDAAAAIGATLREYGGVVLASATLTPVDGFSAACGLNQTGSVILPRVRKASGSSQGEPSREAQGSEPIVEGGAPPTGSESEGALQRPPERLGTLNKRATRKLYQQLTSGAELLRVEEARDTASPALLRAQTPWRDGAYEIAFDARVDTTFQHRSRFYAETAATAAALQSAAGGPIAVFFPSYAYAESIRQDLAASHPAFRVAVQPKVRDLAAQTAWVEESLFVAEALFLVLGSSFAESIDALGGRITHAMVVGPALPEVNAVQRARLAEAARKGQSREAAFRAVYQIPGMTKVNQALGRLVRAPGQRARVLLHCRRFQEASYLELLAPEYRDGTAIADDHSFAAWLKRGF